MMNSLTEIREFVSKQIPIILEKDDNLNILQARKIALDSLSKDQVNMVKKELKKASDKFICEELSDMFVLKAYSGDVNFSDKYIAYSVKKIRGISKYAINKACEDCIDEVSNFVPDIGFFLNTSKNIDKTIKDFFKDIILSGDNNE